MPWQIIGLHPSRCFYLMQCTRCGFQTNLTDEPEPCPVCKERERRMDNFEFTLHSPITDEEWDLLTDVNLDHTDNITFQTKNGKKVRFVKEGPEIIRCKDCIKREYCRTSTVWAVAPGDEWFCADAERREGDADAD